ncbi:hypothetical protein SAMN06272735_3933 [Streptomyces sp. TLI_55]|nr:hypothetical protein SAMN06272735_3933 [Streptomyces sp. TLI_55]
MKLVANFQNMVKLQGGWRQQAEHHTMLRPGGIVMPFAIAVAAIALGFEQLVQWKWGPMGIIAFLLLTVGVKAKNTMVGGLGAAILVMLLAQSG